MAETQDQERAKQRLFRIQADVLVEGNLKVGPDGGLEDLWSASLAEAIRVLRAPEPAPKQVKYFSGSQPRREEIEAIDEAALSSEMRGEARDNMVRLLCSDMLHLCMALKPQRCCPATLEDPNISMQHVKGFFEGASEEALDRSLEDLDKLVQAILAEGCDDMAESPAKLRALLVMMNHPRLANAMPGGDGEEEMKNFLRLLGQLHAHSKTRNVLSKWYASFPIAELDEALGRVRQYLTIAMLQAQDQLDSNSMEAVANAARRGAFTCQTRNLLRLHDIYWRANEKRRERALHWKTRREAELMRERGELPDAELAEFLAPSQFHNDAINSSEGLLKNDLKEVLEMQQRGQYWAALEEDKRHDFGVVEFPFVLTPVSKVRMLGIESLIMQREEVRSAMAMQFISGRVFTNPWLVLKVRRTSIIGDALQQLAQVGSSQMKKPLKVVFDGEEGVDEGGVQKEFFQILIEEMYKEDYGMFEKVENENFWFNKNSFEASVQFELFGSVLGLAIYNQVILDVRFPPAVYSTLMLGKQAKLGLSDLLDFQPSLARGLIQLLEWSDRDSFESTFGSLTFMVDYECFGTKAEVELKEGGKDIAVTFDNREEYVQRYCDWIFNTSVQRQSTSFRKGFDQCIGDTLFRQLFRSDELELVICGQLELDFDSLQAVTQYQDGYTEKSPTVQWFWEVVKSLDEDAKRNFLMFCTGCDRAPVGGLGKLPFIISRGGPDSSMLPSVHTCFNHVLLPEYSSKEKLERLLHIAIKNCTGFGLM
mmetsp:Transcript_35161/g.80504  ORF Transcript_35161/g.80504 Transcript_35161/m.80504 type:complete len:765 (-) Transcript_35161:67-2361(-)